MLAGKASPPQWFQSVQNGQHSAWFRVLQRDFDFTTFDASLGLRQSGAAAAFFHRKKF
jgi:hypothetical protein